MRQYQIVQVTPDRVVVKVVPAAGFSADAARRISQLLRPVLAGIEAEVEFVESIAAEPSGKYRIVRSDLVGQ